MTHQVQLRRTVKCSPEKAFEAWTDPEIMFKWFMPPGMGLKLNLDAREGGTYRFEVQRGPDDEFGCSGSYTVFEPPSRLAFTWHWDESSFDTGVSLVEIEFNPVPEGTELVLTHSKLQSEVSEVRHTEGWTALLDRFQSSFEPK